MKFEINLLYVLVIAQTFISILYAAPLKVGVVLPLTGGFSSIGVEIQRGMQLALKETKDSFADHDIAVLGNLSENVYVTQIYIKDQEFYGKYSSEFGSVTAINLGFAALGYDAIKLTQNLYHSLKESGEEKDLKHTLKSQLNSLEYSGYTGKIDFRFSRVASDRREGIFVVKNRVLEKVDLNNVR